jgi:hypothetical protein
MQITISALLKILRDRNICYGVQPVSDGSDNQRIKISDWTNNTIVFSLKDNRIVGGKLNCSWMDIIRSVKKNANTTRPTTTDSCGHDSSTPANSSTK